MTEGFYRPQTIEDALQLKEEFQKEALFLAGGTEINSLTFSPSPKHLISLDGLGLTEIKEEGDELSIGACCTMQQLLESDLVYSPLTAALRKVVNRNIRNVATLGGHIALNPSCSDLLPMLIALETEVLLQTIKGERRVKVEEYIQDEQEGLIVSVLIKRPAKDRCITVANYTRTASDISLISAASSFTKGKDSVKDVIIAVSGAAPKARRVEAVEKALEGKSLPDSDELAKDIKAQLNPTSDFRGSADFKSYMAGVLAASSLHAAWCGEEVV